MKIKNKKIIEHAVNIVLNVLIGLFVVILLISLYISIQVKFLGHGYANFFGYSMFEVQTNSMAKTIKAGDWIIVKLTKDVKNGDIVTYEAKGNYITHRIVQVYNKTYITKGDANSAKDDPVDQKQIIGKSVKILGNFGILRKTILNPIVLVTLLITLFLFNSILKKDRTNNTFIKKTNQFIDIVLKKIKSIRKNNKEGIKLGNKKEEVVIENKELFTEVSQGKETLSDYKFEVDDLLNAQMTKLKDFEKELNGIQGIQSMEDLDQTRMHRVISVDLDEIDEMRLEIAKNKVSETDIIPKVEEEIIPEITEENNDLTNVNLEMEPEGNKNSKNIIDAMMNIKKDELHEIINLLLKDNKPQTNEATIKNTFIYAYIYARYYNYYNDKDIYHGKSLILKIEKMLMTTAEELINYYNGSDNKYSDKVYMYANLFKVIANIDQAKDSVIDLNSKKQFFKETISSHYPDCSDEKQDFLVMEIIKIQKSFIDVSKDFLKNLETPIFYLEFNKVTTTKNLYAVDLEHNINFNKVYSDYIIDKTYTEGIVAEDKISVLFTLLSTTLINNMITREFNKKYVCYIPDSLYEKEKKLLRFLRMLDDEYAKSHVIILLTLNNLVDNNNIIATVKKLGYHFAVILDDNVRLNQKELNALYMINIIFINDRGKNVDGIVSNIPEDLLENIIYDDITNKIKSIGDDEE